MRIRRRTFGIIELSIGILFVAVGLFTFIFPTYAMERMIFVYGVLAIINGIGYLIFFFRRTGKHGFVTTIPVVGGILIVILGVLMVVDVGAAQIALAVWFPCWFLLQCCTRLTQVQYVWDLAGTKGHWVTIIFSVLGIMLSFILLFQPMISLIVLANLIGLILALVGINMSIFGIWHIK